MLILLAAGLLALVAWLYLLVGHGGYWRTGHRLPAAGGGDGPGALPSGPGAVAVVAVVPARDEADMLPRTLPTLLAQDCPGGLAVVLVDDESADGTAQVAATLGEQPRSAGAGQATRLVVVPGQPAPPGWAGKVWAMEQGVRAAPESEFVLFTDADIGYAPGALRALVEAAGPGDWALVSQLALLRARSRWERLLIPAFVYFFAQLYPFRRASRPGGRTAAAAGGCMLVRRRALVAAAGLEQIKGARIDDVALAGLLKRAGGACWLGFTTEVVSHRRYRGLGEVWDMVARSAYTQLRYSPAVLAATVLGLAWLYLVPVAAAATGLALPGGGQAAWLAGVGLSAWAVMAGTYLPVLRLFQLSAARAPLLPLIAALYTAMTVSSAWRHHAGRGGEWKGRIIPT